MPRNGGNGGIDRRNLLKGLGVAGVAGLAGCSSSEETATPETATPETLGDTLLDPEGNQIELSAVYSTGDKTTETTMEFVKQKLGEVGISVSLTGLGFNQMLVKYAQNGGSFNGGPRDESTSEEQWDLMGGIGFNSYPRTPSSINVFWTDESEDIATVNFYGYKPSEPINEKLQQGSSTTDDSERQELFSAVFGIVSRDQPADFLTFSTNLNGFRSNVEGLGEPTPNFGWDSVTRYIGDQSASGTYKIGVGSGAKTLNPLRSNDTSSDARIELQLDGAYALVGDESEFQGLWVESYSQSDDATEYEFTLRDGLQWGNGYGQMTADDWVYYIENVKQADVNWAGDVNFDQFKQGGEPMGVEKTGELSFKLTLPSPDPLFIKKPVMWAAYCLPQGLLEPYVQRVAEASSKEDKTSIGNELNKSAEIQEVQYAGNLGPYTYNRWDRDAVYVADRNDDYYGANTVADWGDVPYFEQIQYQVFGEQSTRVSAFKTGEVQQTGVPQGQFETLQGNDDINIIQTPTAFCGMMVYNQRANGWEELRQQGVRQALSTAVPKQVITEQINRGLADMAFTHQPEYSQWYSDEQVTRFGGPDSTSVGAAQRQLADTLPDGYSFE